MKETVAHIRALTQLLALVATALLLFSLNPTTDRLYREALPALELLRSFSINPYLLEAACWKGILAASDADPNTRKLNSEREKAILQSALPESNVQSGRATVLGYIPRPDARSLYEWKEFLLGHHQGAVWAANLEEPAGPARAALVKAKEGGNLKDLEKQRISGFDLVSDLTENSNIVSASSNVKVICIQKPYPRDNAWVQFYSSAPHSGRHYDVGQPHLVPVSKEVVEFDIPDALRRNPRCSALYDVTSRKTRLNPRLEAVLQNVGNLSVVDAIAECRKRSDATLIKVPLLTLDLHPLVVKLGGTGISVAILLLLWAHIQHVRRNPSLTLRDDGSREWLGFYSSILSQVVSFALLVALPIAAALAVFLRVGGDAATLTDLILLFGVVTLACAIWLECNEARRQFAREDLASIEKDAEEWSEGAF